MPPPRFTLLPIPSTITPAPILPVTNPRKPTSSPSPLRTEPLGHPKIDSHVRTLASLITYAEPMLVGDLLGQRCWCHLGPALLLTLSVGPEAFKTELRPEAIARAEVALQATETTRTKPETAEDERFLTEEVEGLVRATKATDEQKAS